MRILITGATGFIGLRLAERLAEKDHDLVVLSRDPEKARLTLAFPAQVFGWDPLIQLPPEAAFHEVDAVIHLAGEPIALRRWDHEQKRRIYNSRIVGTESLMKRIADLEGRKPRVVVSASAVGFYGDRGDDSLNENSERGPDFLAKVVQDWERAAALNAPTGVRVVHTRSGMVLGPGGGALTRLLPLFQQGFGGVLGQGRQWLSWIHVEDLIRVIERCIEDPSLSGPVNAVAPNPVTNRQFSETLAKVLDRKLFLGVPAAALKTVLGQMSTVLLSSQRAVPEVLENGGFKFRFEDLDDALSDLFSTRASREGEAFFSHHWVNRPVEEVFEFFADERNLEALSPPWMKIEVSGKSTETMRQGTRIDIRARVKGIPLKWQARIDEWKPNLLFRDVQEHGPLRLWEHTHRFRPLKGGTLIEDQVFFQPPGGRVGALVGRRFARSDLERMFSWRKERLNQIFAGAGRADTGS